MLASCRILDLAAVLVGMLSFCACGEESTVLLPPSKAELKLWPSCRHTNLQRPKEYVLDAATTHEPPWELGTATEDESCEEVPILEMLLGLANRNAVPHLLPLAEVCHRPMYQGPYGGIDDPTVCTHKMDPRRLAHACPLVPAIAVEGMRNPCSSRFRMMDGRHRICKLKCSVPEASHSWFYLLNSSEVLEIIRPPCFEPDELDEEEWLKIKRFMSASDPRSLLAVGLPKERKAMSEPFPEEL